MIGEDQQQKYLPLSNAVLPGFMRWTSYGLIAFLAITCVVAVFHLPQFLQDVRTDKIDLNHWISDNWIWPLLALQIAFGAKRYTYRCVLVAVYLVVILWLEISHGIFGDSKGWFLTGPFWQQIILLVVVLLLPIWVLMKRPGLT